MLINSFPQVCTTEKHQGRFIIAIFPDTILQQIWYYMGAHNLGTQIKDLHKLVPVTKGKLFVSYENGSRGRQMFVYVFISHSVNKRISMDSMQKIGQK